MVLVTNANAPTVDGQMCKMFEVEDVNLIKLSHNHWHNIVHNMYLVGTILVDAGYITRHRNH